MKIVQFKNGKYAIRRMSIYGYEFLTQHGTWFSLESFKKLSITLGDNSLSRIKAIYDELNDVGNIIK